MGERFSADDSVSGQQDEGIVDQRSEPGMLDLDSVYAVLDHPRRRLVLDTVSNCEYVSTDDLAIRIAARENDLPVHVVADEDRRDVAIALYHVHIPKLVDAGVITVEDDAERIRPGPHADQVLAASRGLATQFESNH